MILNYIFNLIEEGKTAKKRGFRFKEVTDPKTGKIKLFRVDRGDELANNVGTHIYRTSTLLNNKEIPNTKLLSGNKKIHSVKSLYNTVNGPIPIPTISIADRRGRVHPGVFYHEVGHELRNTDNMSTAKKEISAWKGAKEISPHYYEMAKTSNIIHQGLGGHLQNNRITQKEYDLSKKINLDNHRHDITNWISNNSKNRKDVLNHIDSLKQNGYDRHELAASTSYLRSALHKNRLAGSLTKPVEVSPDHETELRKKGWSYSQVMRKTP